MHVLVDVGGPLVLGLSISDVVLDAARQLDEVHPVMRAVYVSNKDAA